MKKILSSAFFVCCLVFAANAQSESVKSDAATPAAVVTAGENVSSDAVAPEPEKSNCGAASKKSCCSSKDKAMASSGKKSCCTQAKKDDVPEGAHPEKE
jgi:hypothetical protein